AGDMIERIVYKIDGNTVQEIWNTAGEYGRSVFNSAGDLIESIGELASIRFPDWIPPIRFPHI
ncbi:hypothetical protein, partial [Bacillus toyonensis]